MSKSGGRTRSRTETFSLHVVGAEYIEPSFVAIGSWLDVQAHHFLAIQV